MNEIFEKLAKSKFRSRFKLGKKDFAYIEEKGIDVIKQHAADFIKKELLLLILKTTESRPR